MRLVSFASAEVKLTLHPSPWFDAPTAVAWRDGWTQGAPYRSTAALVMPILGAGIVISYLGAVGFNTRRALFGRMRRPKASAKVDSPGPPAGGGAAPPGPNPE